MGLFNLFKKPTIIHDDVFGLLRFMEFKNASSSYFEGKGYFTPTNSEIQFIIRAGIDGPSEKQKEFYRNVESKYTTYIEKMKLVIEAEFRNWKDEFAIQDFNNEFKLVCINIPAIGTTPITWDLAFTTIHDLNHHVTVEFINDEPTGVLIDG